MRHARDNSDLARRIGARVRNLREERAITQERLAWTCELSKGYLSKVESGRALPTLEVLARLASVLGVELLDFMVVEQSSPRHRLVEALRTGDIDAAREAAVQLSLFSPSERK